jgi:hypothetical protein
MAALGAYFERDADPPPVVFIASDTHQQPWGYRRGTSQTVRAALPPGLVPKAYVFVGNVRDFLARRPTTTPDVASVSQGSLRDALRGIGDRRPAVLLIRQWNHTPQNLRFMTPPLAVPLDEDLSMVEQGGVAAPEQQLVQRAVRAGAIERQYLGAKRSMSFGQPTHLLRVIGGLLLVFVIPGLLAIRWFHRVDSPLVLALVPGISVTINVLVGLVVLGVTQKPVTSGMAYLIVGLAVAAGGALAFWSRTSRTEALVPSP